jgi:hypothetical protein
MLDGVPTPELKGSIFKESPTILNSCNLALKAHSLGRIENDVLTIVCFVWWTYGLIISLWVS